MAKPVVQQFNQLEVNDRCVEEHDHDDCEDVVNPWTVVSKSATGVDYDKLISK